MVPCFLSSFCPSLFILVILNHSKSWQSGQYKTELSLDGCERGEGQVEWMETKCVLSSPLLRGVHSHFNKSCRGYISCFEDPGILFSGSKGGRKQTEESSNQQQGNWEHKGDNASLLSLSPTLFDCRNRFLL